MKTHGQREPLHSSEGQGESEKLKKFLREDDILPMGFEEEVGFCWLKRKRSPGEEDRSQGLSYRE